MNTLAQYVAVRGNMQVGDVVFFAGTQVISRLIGVFSGPSFDPGVPNLTHCGLIRQTMHANGPFDIMMNESTIEAGRRGVQTNPLGTTLANYGDGARAWWCPLSDEVRRDFNLERFYVAIGVSDGIVGYPIKGLLGFLARSIPIIGTRVGQSENAKSKVCSQHVASVLEDCGVIRGVNYQAISPQQCAEMHIYREAVQLVGTPAKIARFNSV